MARFGPTTTTAPPARSWSVSRAPRVFHGTPPATLRAEAAGWDRAGVSDFETYDAGLTERLALRLTRTLTSVSICETCDYARRVNFVSDKGGGAAKQP